MANMRVREKRYVVNNGKRVGFNLLQYFFNNATALRQYSQLAAGQNVETSVFKK